MEIYNANEWDQEKSRSSQVIRLSLKYVSKKDANEFCCEHAEWGGCFGFLGLLLLLLFFVCLFFGFF
jgi:hypothetical protein